MTERRSDLKEEQQVVAAKTQESAREREREAQLELSLSELEQPTLYP
jgi:hypothetical protein